MRITIVGPVAPFRGGIARHSTASAVELARRAGVELSVVSFARQYPAILYPGESDLDPEAAAPAGLDVDFCIDSLNPLNWRAAARRIIERHPDLVVVPAWTFFLAPCLGWIARTVRRRGIPVTMIVHNAEDHDSRAWKRTLSRFQLRQASRFVTHNESIAADLRRLCPSVPVSICPHPVYDDYPAARGALPRRAPVELLCFGLIRAYKGLDIALRALAEAGRPDMRLTIVGEFWEARAETEALIRDLGVSDRVELVPRFVSDQEAAEFFARCDAVLAPYRTATGSGVVALAQWYRRPVIASDVPGLAEAIEDGVTGWLFPAGDAPALAEILATKVTRAAAEAMHGAIAEVGRNRTWQRFGDTIVDR